ncbi:MAG: hypothetical protein IJW04_01340 [Ruminococcus sp.]|nr:hypothetical protein [Ruminococcus sp.]
MAIRDFDLMLIMKRVVAELDGKIDECIEIEREKTPDFSKAKFLESIGDVGGKVFPISGGAYYSYKKASNEKSKSSKLKTIKLDTFYSLCEYTDMSADYLLGLTDTRRKEETAHKVREEFGLSDLAMENLSVCNRVPECRGEVSSEVINLILENREFLEKLNFRLPVLISCLNESRMSKMDIDVVRYTVVRAFEELLDDICDSYKYSDLPCEELDKYSPFGF